MSYRLNSLKGDYIAHYYKGYSMNTRSLDYSSYEL